MDEHSKLHATISNLAKTLEDERKQWEETLAAKDTEIAAVKNELEKQLAHIKTAEEQMTKHKEGTVFLEAENCALKAEIEEIKKSKNAELENREKELRDELQRTKQALLEEELKTFEKELNEERLKWREKLRTA